MTGPEIARGTYFRRVLVGEKQFPRAPMNGDKKNQSDTLLADMVELNEWLGQVRAKCPDNAQLQIHSESDNSSMTVSVFHLIPETDEEAAERLKASEVSGSTSTRSSFMIGGFAGAKSPMQACGEVSKFVASRLAEGA